MAAKFKSDFLNVLDQRGFIHQISDPEGLDALAVKETITGYVGYDATANVVKDWQYAKVAQSYVLDDEVREWVAESNPWALHGITERLLEAVQRGLWAEPDPDLLDQLRDAHLEAEGAVEGRGGEPA